MGLLTACANPDLAPASSLPLEISIDPAGVRVLQPMRVRDIADLGLYAPGVDPQQAVISATECAIAIANDPTNIKYHPNLTPDKLILPNHADPMQAMLQLPFPCDPKSIQEGMLAKHQPQVSSTLPAVPDTQSETPNQPQAELSPQEQLAIEKHFGAIYSFRISTLEASKRGCTMTAVESGDGYTIFAGVSHCFQGTVTELKTANAFGAQKGVWTQQNQFRMVFAPYGNGNDGLAVVKIYGVSSPTIPRSTNSATSEINRLAFVGMPAITQGATDTGLTFSPKTIVAVPGGQNSDGQLLNIIGENEPSGGHSGSPVLELVPQPDGTFSLIDKGAFGGYYENNPKKAFYIPLSSELNKAIEKIRSMP